MEFTFFCFIALHSTLTGTAPHNTKEQIKDSTGHGSETSTGYDHKV